MSILASNPICRRNMPLPKWTLRNLILLKKKKEPEKQIHDIRSNIIPAFLLFDAAKAHSNSRNTNALEQLVHYLWQVIEKMADNEKAWPQTINIRLSYLFNPTIGCDGCGSRSHGKYIHVS